MNWNLGSTGKGVLFQLSLLSNEGVIHDLTLARRG
jgi:hypothetical protein